MTIDKDKTSCEWIFNHDDSLVDGHGLISIYNYETDCGHAFDVNNGTATENGMKFCCFCGKPLEDSEADHD